MPPRRRLGARRAFTLIELIMSLAIVGVLVTLATGQTARYVNNQRVARAAQAMSEDIQSAFALVGRDRKPVRISWTSSSLELDLTDRSVTTYFRKRRFGTDSDYKLSSSDFTVSRTYVDVYPPGLSSDTLNIKISRNGAKRTISLARGGMVRVLNQ